MTDVRSQRIWKWASYKVKSGKCRFLGCENDEVAETAEGDMCLDHYIGLPACEECGGPACGSMEPIRCMSCQDMSETTRALTATFSSLENEGGLLDSAYGVRKEIRPFEKRIGRAELVSWAKAIMRRSEAG